MATLQQALVLVAQLPRPDIEALVDGAIALLDLLDGDVDFEPEEEDECADDRGEGEELLPDRPLYAVDQSLGPINEVAACKARDARLIAGTQVSWIGTMPPRRAHPAAASGHP